jgi:hypothetical protein
VIQGPGMVRLVLVVAAAAAALGSCSEGIPPETPSAPQAVVPTPTPIPTPTPVPQLASPNPSATPDVCPILNRWSSGMHNITLGNQPVRHPLVGGAVVIDSTPLFEGRPCNLEHDHCGGRHCEDPRGGEWTLLVGTSASEVRGEGYQFRIGPLKEGPHRWRVCPRRDAQDAEGMPLQTGQFACTEGIFTVLTAPPPPE